MCAIEALGQVGLESAIKFFWEIPQRTPKLLDSDVHVWSIPLLRKDEEYHKLSKFLSPDEQVRAGSYHFQHHRERFIACRGCLRVLLGNYFHIDPTEVFFDYGPAGKPELLAPALYEGKEVLKFNVSHSDDVALIAFNLVQNVGVDVEKNRVITDCEHIAENFFSEPEVKKILHLPSRRRDEAFLNCWTRKEAYLKARGDGIIEGLNHFEVSLLPAEKPEILKPLEVNSTNIDWQLFHFQPAENFVGALAVQAPSDLSKSIRYFHHSFK